LPVEVEVGTGEVAVGVRVLVGEVVGGAPVAVGVRVLVGDVVAGTPVAVGVGGLVGVEVAGGRVLVGVCVGLEPELVSTTSWGALAPDSRADMFIAVEPAVTTARLNKPFACTEEVISTTTQPAALTGAELPNTFPMAGALL